MARFYTRNALRTRERERSIRDARQFATSLLSSLYIFAVYSGYKEIALRRIRFRRIYKMARIMSVNTDGAPMRVYVDV